MADIDYLKRNVFPGESGGDYNALFGYSNRPEGQFAGVNLTDLTVDQALAFANPSGPYGQWVKGQVGRVATPMGAYQIVGTTLGAAKKGLGLTGSEKMTPELQDQLGLWIYQTQGPGAWEAWGKGGGGGGQVTTSTKGGAPMNGLLDIPQDDQGGGIMSLLTGKQKPWASKLNDIGAVLLALSGSPAAQPLLQMVKDRKEGKREDARANKTMQWLAEMGTPQAMEALKYAQATGDIVGATKMATTPADPGFRTLTPEEVTSLGLPPGVYQMGGDGKISQIGGGGTSVSVDLGGGPELGKLSTDYGYVLDPATGMPKIDPETGLPMAAPVPGSPAAREAEAAAAKAGMREENAANTAAIVLQDIDKAIDQTSGLTAGVGSLLGAIPGTGARDLQSSIDTIVANIGFDRLQQMREASPTGGALGGIAVPELQMLQAVLGSLRTDQSPEQLKANLQRLKEIYEPIARKAAAYPNASDFGFGGGAADAPAAPAGDLSDDDLLRLYGG
jgi:hypothetical protein